MTISVIVYAGEEMMACSLWLNVTHARNGFMATVLELTLKKRRD
jgi:hypothetical protein